MGKKQGPEDKDSQHTRPVKKTKQAKQEKKRHPVVTTLKVTGFTIGSLVVLGAALGVGYVSSMLKGMPKVNAATFANNRAPSTVYDRNGKVIGRFNGDGDRQPISSIRQVSPDLVNAFVAAEDKTFYTNIGINPLAMGRALVQDVLGHKIESGASTITQQTVKLAVFPQQQRTIHRKVQEIALAIQVNHQLTKDEIMTDYMNWVYMGRLGTDPVYGVKRASEILFGKDPKDLTLAESTFLASIPNNPSYFSPYQFPQHTIQRQHYILNQMLANKMISQSSYTQAMNFDILKDIHKAPTTGLPQHPYLMLDEVKPRVIQSLVKAGLYDNANDAEAALPTAGLKIYTTIDLKKQQDVESVLHNQSLFKNTDKTYQSPNGKKTTDLYEAGFTIIDNQTGSILAVGGGRDYLKDSYDHADIARQPGSSIKPLLDYGPAIDTQTITAATPIYDAPTHFTTPSGNWDPKDDEPDFEGLISARRALYESRNVPAIDVLETITPQVGFSYLNKVGLGTTDTTLDGNPTIVADDANHLSSAIGGLDHGATVEQMTSAYTTFPNQGVWHQGYMISKIVDETGRNLYTANPKTAQVFSPATAYIITDMLHDVLYNPWGTAPMVGSKFPGQYISGKTGTTDSREDGWFIGYTPKYTAGIWMGYNHHEPINRSDYNLKFTVWSDIMAPILKQDPSKKPWPKPNNVVDVKVSSISGQLPTALSTAHGSIDTEPFIEGTQPTQKDSVDVSAKYVVIGGKKYLATTNTPPQDVKTGVFIKMPTVLDAAHKIPNGVTLQTPYLLPTTPDPRGGQVLDAGTDNTATGSGLSAPDQVSGQLTNNTVSLSWNAVDGAVQYQVYRSTSQDGPYQQIGTTQNTSFTDSNFPSTADTLFYEIYAQSNNAMSTGSIPFEIQVSASVLPPGLDNSTGSPPDLSNDTGNSSNSTSDTSNRTSKSSSTGHGKSSGETGNSTGSTNSTGDQSAGGSTNTTTNTSKSGTTNNTTNTSKSGTTNNTTPSAKSWWLPGFGDGTSDTSTN